ncbi:hypothetical protein [Chromobacterium haemolyticum]|uniref:hypothetical protein n=1 Tax=Chromobacterium haemolyticum TaxID=394935 RepID=UPI0009D95EE8|nr:hypothetical protein [Chromobacterium haemolyticum]OQS41537.1 hypothetical protein B0T39_08870 [Chromobacterium haemolyticum]
MTARPGWSARWRGLSNGDRILLGLSFSLAVHGLAIFAPWPVGGARGEPAGLSVRLTAARPPLRLEPAAAPPAWTAPRAEQTLPEAAFEAEPEPAPRPSASAPAAELPAAASAPLAEATQPGDELPQRLGLDLYYPASQLEQLAVPLRPIELPELADLTGGAIRIELRVYINERGEVDAVQWVSAQPAGSEQPLLERFRQAGFSPARKDGIAVKSYKRILIESEPGDGAASTPQPGQR